MRDITEKQEILFKNLKMIQEHAVVGAMAERKANDNLEDLLYNVSYEAICGFLVFIDGYGSFADNLKLDLIDKETGESMRNNIELHDKCADYLRCTI